MKRKTIDPETQVVLDEIDNDFNIDDLDDEELPDEEPLEEDEA